MRHEVTHGGQRGAPTGATVENRATGATAKQGMFIIPSDRLSMCSLSGKMELYCLIPLDLYGLCA